ncbi:hypothetical protein [Congregibacter sp.]|uniref:hypothetical protein n=1 Tax=Congregibacter sp. TaxID=2744308 RepID=UPI003F6A9BAF
MGIKSGSWFSSLREGLVIVGSILLAFALDAWWGDMSRKNELSLQLTGVASELQSTRASLASVRRAHEYNVELTERLRATLASVEEGAEVVVSDESLGPLLPQVTADVTTNSLSAYIAAGGLELISDQDLRAELLAWPAQIEDLQDDEIYLRNFAAADLSRWLRTHADVSNAEVYSVPVVLGHFGVAPPPDPALLGTVVLRRDRELMNLIAARESGERAVLINIEQLLVVVDRHLDAIKRSH